MFFTKLFARKKKAQQPTESQAACLGIDLEMNYCPTCGGEYRAEIERCADCGVDLISGRQRLREMQQLQHDLAGATGKIEGHEPLAALRTGNLGELKSLAKLLENHGLPARVIAITGSESMG